MRAYLLLALVGLGAILIGARFLKYDGSSSPGETIIEITRDGCSPREATIPRGAAVTFDAFNLSGVRSEMVA